MESVEEDVIGASGSPSGVRGGEYREAGEAGFGVEDVWDLF